jgi:AAA domain/CHC2 zinc finger
VSEETQQLKARVGRKPFDDRVAFNAEGFGPCPFHNGDGQTSMHLKRMDDGAWVATCFSACNQKHWDAIAFVQEFDSVDFKEAVRKLGGTSANEAKPMDTARKAEPKKRMTHEQWQMWGRSLTSEDVARLAKSREGKGRTASFETFQKLGCRVQGDYIAFPNRYTTKTGEVMYDNVRLRHMDRKELRVEFNMSMHGLVNRDAVNTFEDVYVVEGEPDIAVMEEAGFPAVGVINGSQTKFEKRALRRLMKAERIFLIGDMTINDDEADEDPGQGCMDNLENLLRSEGATNVHRITFDDAHDVSELAQKEGASFAKRIAELRDEAVMPWVVKNIKTISQLDPKPPEWVVHEIFPYGCLTLLSGKQGSMKSLIALAAAKAITGAPMKADTSIGFDGNGNRTECAKAKFLGRDILHEIPVLYVDSENPQSEVSKRKEMLGILGRRNFYYWGEWEHGDKSVPSAVDDPRILAFADAGGYIMYDSLQDWYGDASEIDNAQMTKLMNKFKHVARRGAGACILHHTPKYGEAGYRGCTAIVAVPDMAIRVSKNDSGVLEFREERFRMCGGWEIDAKFHFGSSYYELELKRDESLSAVARRTEIAKRQKEDNDEKDAERVVAEITKTPDAGPTAISKHLQPRIGEPRVEKLAKSKGWVWSKEQKTWFIAPSDVTLYDE